VRVQYRQFPAVTVFYARSMGPYESASREAWRAISEWLDQHQARKRVKQAFGLIRDDPNRTAPELLRYDACVPVISCADIEPGPGIGRQILPGGAFAVHTHVGSYNETGSLFSQLHREIVPTRALTVDYERPFMTIYLNDPKLTREMHRRSELCVPVFPIPMFSASNDDNGQASDNVTIMRRIAQTG
jgi:DNA gyrase inhibitor GyrI